MKTYYNEYLAFSEEGSYFLRKINEVMLPLIEEEWKKGFSPSEIADLVNNEVGLIMAEKRLRFGLAKRLSAKEA